MNALPIIFIIILFVAFPIYLILTGGRGLKLPKSLFKEHSFIVFVHALSVLLSIVLGLAIGSVEIIAIGVYTTAAFNTFIFKLFATSNQPTAYIAYLVLFWGGVFYIPHALNVEYPFF